MALRVLPVRNDLPAYQFRTQLDEIAFQLSFRYNSRADRWFMDVADANDEPLITGIRILSTSNLIPFLKRNDWPPGEFIAFHDVDLQLNATRETFGELVKLYYEEATE